MTKKTQKPGREDRGFLRPPAYPWTGRALLNELKRHLARKQNCTLTFRRLSGIIGQPTSTTHYWFEVFRNPQLMAFFCMLERLSPPERHAYVDAYCRTLPHLDHPAISRDPDTHGKLNALLALRSGISILTGPSDRLRTFLFTALGHSMVALHGRDWVTGVDLRRPDAFVPVEPLHYVALGLGAANMTTLVQDIWPRVATSKAVLVLLNRVWSAVPRLRPQILRCSALKHVVLCEPPVPKVEFDIPGQKYVIEVLPSRSDRSGLSFEVRKRHSRAQRGH